MCRIKTHFGHHASPSDEVGFNFGFIGFLVLNNGLKQAFQVLILGVVGLAERVETLAQVDAEARRIVVAYGTVVGMVLVVVIV